MRDTTKIRILTVTVLVLLIIIAILLIRKCSDDGSMIIDPSATDIVDSNENGAMSGEGIKVIGFKRITVKAGRKDIDSYFINPSENKVYFVASLYLEDGTLLYKSNLIPPGKAIYRINISKPLEPGDYDAVVYYETYSVETMEKKNTAEIKFVITAENE